MSNKIKDFENKKLKERFECIDCGSDEHVHFRESMKYVCDKCLHERTITKSKILKKAKVKYILELFDLKTEKFKILHKFVSLENLVKCMSFNLQMNKDWYSYKNGKKAKLRIRAVEMKGSKVIKQWEEYKLTKNWKIKGYFKNWGKMG